MRSRTIAVAIALPLLAWTAARAETGKAEEPQPPADMTTYQLVFVVKNPDFKEEDWVDPALADHRADRTKTASDVYARNLVKDKVAVIAGSLPDDDDIEQVAVLDVNTAQEAEAVYRHSPAIESGRLKLEIYSWWAENGILKRPRDPFDVRDAYLGLLRRPDKAPDLPQEELERIQEGHLENLKRMAASGELVIAGPIENGADLRGILIFREHDAGHIRELVDRDPAIRAGRLKLELYRWQVPKGNWIRRSEQKASARQQDGD
jgi:uncharacterized protein YciI